MRLPTDLLEFETGEQIFIEPKLLINDSYSLLDCAKNDMGFVKLQHYVVAEAIRKGELVKILTNYTHPPITLKVFYQPEKFLQNKVRAFVEHVCEDLPETI
jgi:DNA-binding transcriptional LysR family regulator